jgi:predicted transcriptional regulator
MATFKVELNQEVYEKLVALAIDDWRPPSWHVEWILKKAIREAYDAAHPTGEAPIGVGRHDQEH